MKIRSVLVGLVCMLGASSAHAVVDFVVTPTVTGGHPLNAVQQGDLITLNIRVANPIATNFIAGIGGAVFGYERTPAIVTFVSAESADTNLFCTNAGATTCSNGLVSTFNTSDPNPPVEATTVATGKFVLFVNAIATTARNGNGLKDPGIDGIVNGGDTEFRVVFQATGTTGSTTFTIGTNTDSQTGAILVVSTAATGGTVDPAVQGNNATVTITVPEVGPLAAGAGALISALGLASLRRRITG